MQGWPHCRDGHIAGVLNSGSSLHRSSLLNSGLAKKLRQKYLVKPTTLNSTAEIMKYDFSYTTVSAFIGPNTKPKFRISSNSFKVGIKVPDMLWQLM